MTMYFAVNKVRSLGALVITKVAMEKCRKQQYHKTDTGICDNEAISL